MNDREFNLLDEPWVRVMRPDCTVEEVSLTQALLHAHEYTDLAGEMPTQDAAVLRVLLALLFAVFARVDAEGREIPFVRPKDAIVRWHSIWELGHFPEQPLRDYFVRWYDRFWLFDSDHPFFQVPDKAWKRVKKTTENKKKGTPTTIIEEAGTPGDAAKLNGELLESDNKLRLFKAVTVAEGLTYAQATRWLISLIAYDDTSAKATKDLPKGKKYLSPGVGWLGRLGYIQAQGKTLFETLMLNLTFLKDGETLWDETAVPEDAYLVLPCWELDRPRDRERTPISCPQTPAALYTVQSRRIRLLRHEGKVEKYLLLGGDFFERENAFVEQMTLWYDVNKKKKNQPSSFAPCPHDVLKQFWREFPMAFVPSDKEGEHQPGVVKWIAALYKKGCLDGEALVHFAVCALNYDKQFFCVKDSFEDGLTFHVALLNDADESVRARVITEIDLCKRAASAVGWLGHDIDMAAGTKEKVPPKEMNNAGKEAMAQFYYRVDKLFRQWLEALTPAGDVDAAIDDWRKTAKGIALALGNELAQVAGPAAFVGRMIKDTKQKTERHHSAPEAMQLFMRKISAIYPR